MPSSPTEESDREAGALARLERVVDSYRHALEALASGDGGKAESLVRMAGAELQEVLPEEIRASGTLGRQAKELHSQLTAITGAARKQVGEQLQELRDSKKAMGGYGGRSRGPGKRLNRQG